MSTGDVQTWLAGVAGYGLPGSLTELPTAVLPDDEWRQLLSGVRFQRLAGLLAAATADGALPLTSEQAEDVRDLHADAMAVVLRLERAMLDIVGLLESHGIDVRVLKGSAFAHLDYADPALRGFADIDLLVPPAQFDDAVSVLDGAGHRRRYPQPRSGFDRRFSKGTSFTTPDGAELDLHRTFVMGPYGLRVDLAELWSRSEPFEVGGQTLHALALDERFLHACYHAALGDVPPRLAPRRDLAEMLLYERVSTARVQQLAVAWGAEAVLAEAVRSTWETLRLADVVALSAWAEARSPTDRDRRDLDVYLRPDNSYAGKSLAAVRALPRWRDRLAFVTALALPDHTYVDGRHTGAVNRLGYGLRAIRRRAPS